MSNIFNGNTINSTPVPLIPNQQVIIPPITIPNGFTALNSAPSLQQVTAKGKKLAKEYRLGPNSKIAIFDEDEPVFYFRETDANGNDVAFRTCSYAEIEEPAEPEYLTVKEFRTAMDELAKSLKEELSNGQSVQTQPTVGKHTFNPDANS